MFLPGCLFRRKLKKKNATKKYFSLNRNVKIRDLAQFLLSRVGITIRFGFRSSPTDVFRLLFLKAVAQYFYLFITDIGV
jgi:hypothetical protein